MIQILSLIFLILTFWNLNSYLLHYQSVSPNPLHSTSPVGTMAASLAFALHLSVRTKTSILHPKKHVCTPHINYQQLATVAPTKIVASAEVGSSPSRRAFLTLLLAPLVVPLGPRNVSATERYDPLKSRRYIDVGRPKPDAEPPKFSSSVPVFSIDDSLQAQDISTGMGDAVSTGDLVRARWLVRLADGTTIDDSNMSQPSLFRPGSHQVPSGIEDSVIGMRVNGERRVSGSAERILT